MRHLPPEYQGSEYGAMRVSITDNAQNWSSMMLYSLDGFCASRKDAVTAIRGILPPER